MELSKLKIPLQAHEIDFRTKQVYCSSNGTGWLHLLPYKSARADMDRLDEALGTGYWQRKHEYKDGRLFCSVGIYNDVINEWIWVQDVGTPSKQEADKGEASDSFKRACFNLGIGRELYNYPKIIIKLNNDEFEAKNISGKTYYNTTNKLKLDSWKWTTKFSDTKLVFICAIDNNGEQRFIYKKLNPKSSLPYTNYPQINHQVNQK